MILRDTQLIISNYKRLENVLRIAYTFQGFMSILVVNNGNSTKLGISKVLFHNNEENDHYKFYVFKFCELTIILHYQ